jgi:hypothetical protein
MALRDSPPIGCVEEIYAQIEGATDEWQAIHFAEAPRALLNAVAHTAKSYARYLQAGSAQIYVFHTRLRGGESGGFRRTMQCHRGHNQGNSGHLARRRNLPEHDRAYDGGTCR